MAEGRSYPSEESALRRVAALRQLGLWPGYSQGADGRWRLTADPDLERAHRPAGDDT
jgi:hypothetical protein